MTHSKTRANALADRLILGAKNLAAFAEGLADSEWNKTVLGDGRTVGVVVHHVASVYPIEVELAQTIGKGNPIPGVTKEAIDQMNAKHALENNQAGKKETLDLLKTNSENAARAIREFTNEELDTAAPISLYHDAPLTAQFFIEDHALRHSFHHLGKIKASL
ncbi:MAG TPA: DinB family protein [Robiginitalea sp.]|nr:DinB family protein [Robiginitalea sp.]